MCAYCFRRKGGTTHSLRIIHNHKPFSSQKLLTYSLTSHHKIHTLSSKQVVENLYRFSKFQVTIFLFLSPLRIPFEFTRGARDFTN